MKDKKGVPLQAPNLTPGPYQTPTARGIHRYRNIDEIDMTQPLKSPFPWAGGKSDIAPAVWRRFGKVDNYVEGFCGSAAMLLGRPGGASGTETVNDLDGLLINSLRAITLQPEETAAWCDWPVSEADLTSRHLWLKSQRDDLTARLFGDPLYCDVQAAGWWLWGIASWIGDGWCVADGPWVSVDGRLVDRRTIGSEAEGVGKKMPRVAASNTARDKHIGGQATDMGIHRYRASVPRQMPELGSSPQSAQKPRGITKYLDRASVPRQMPEVGAAGAGGPKRGRGVLAETYHRKGIQAHRYGVPKKMPKVGANGAGVDSSRAGVYRMEYDQPSALEAYFAALADRLRRVRFLCGDWKRAVKDSITVNHGLTALYLDPEYPSHEHSMGYHKGEQQPGEEHIWYQVARWAVSRGDDKRLRIAISGYWSEEADALFPASWARERWQARGGYANQSKNGRGRENAARECVWFSPHCIDPANDYDGTLFEGL